MARSSASLATAKTSPWKKLKDAEAEKQIEKINSKLIALVEKFVNDARLCQVEIVNERIGLKSPNNKLVIAAPLSKRETEILYCLSLHKTPKEISRILSLAHGREVSIRSVQTIINEKLYSKLDVHSTSHLIEQADRPGSDSAAHAEVEWLCVTFFSAKARHLRFAAAPSIPKRKHIARPYELKWHQFVRPMASSV